MVLRNARHELFAQAIASGKAPSEAYVLAGFAYNTGNASRLNALESVRTRVSELHRAMAARSVKQANYTREWVVEELIDNVTRAKAVKDFSAANAALRLLGVERQMFIDRKESGAPGDFAGLGTRDALLAKAREELGADAADALAAFLAASDAKPDLVDALPVPTAPGGNA